MRYIHHTVCHKENYVDPITGYYTKVVERSWVDAKDVLKRARYPATTLQAHLDEVIWHKMNKDLSNGLLPAFVVDDARYFK